MTRRSWGPVAPLILILAACGGAGSEISSDNSRGASASVPTNPLREAVSLCQPNPQEQSAINFGDQDKTLIMDGDDAGVSGVGPTSMFCILGAVGLPDATRSQISNTRALDGMQSASWSGYEATWTYHPDNGLDLTLQRKA